MNYWSHHQNTNPQPEWLQIYFRLFTWLMSTFVCPVWIVWCGCKTHFSNPFFRLSCWNCGSCRSATSASLNSGGVLLFGLGLFLVFRNPDYKNKLKWWPKSCFINFACNFKETIISFCKIKAEYESFFLTNVFFLWYFFSVVVVMWLPLSHILPLGWTVGVTHLVRWRLDSCTSISVLLNSFSSFLMAACAAERRMRLGAPEDDLVFL